MNAEAALLHSALNRAEEALNGMLSSGCTNAIAAEAMFTQALKMLGPDEFITMVSAWSEMKKHRPVCSL